VLLADFAAVKQMTRADDQERAGIVLGGVSLDLFDGCQKSLT
jgi:hypothetical protein